ncbi:LysR family transcriptional regulator [Halotalea alkalilenta]|uniref:LysR family transcriptional regulator n=1 Tax=Halotalea alkalilenta TaxID=376489 RepID=UPI0004812A2D|nr:LysR family transcriptional regulator [Halotalea alkalilenta]
MIRELKTFLAVVEYGTFAAAGLQVGLSQSSVSAQIKQLETRFGERLFDRTGRIAVLNAAGKRILPLAEEMVGLERRMLALNEAEELRGELRVGAIASLQSGRLPQALLRLRERAPKLRVRLVPGVSLGLLDQVDAGSVDLALLLRAPFALPKELHAEGIGEEPYVVIAPRGENDGQASSDPLHLLATEPFIRYDRSSFGGRLVERFLKRQRITPRQVIEADELEAIARMVECGLGVSLIPAAGPWLERSERLRVLSLGEVTFHRELVLVSRASQRRAAALTLFADCLRSAIAGD